jgi:glucose-6-phosphate isomerase
MSDNQVRLYYKNVMADVIGAEHGITVGQLEQLAEKTTPIIRQLNKAADKAPYRALPDDKAMVERVKNMAGRLRQGCENLVVLGIGGSALGNIALQTALNPYMYNLDDKQRCGPRLFVLDNIDPPQLTSFLDWIDDKLDRTVFNVISKSGRTAETASQLLIIRQKLIDRFGPAGPQQRIVATTDSKKGTLRKIVNQEKLPSLQVPDGVGGRFSVLSDVGLFSACMCGIDIDSLLAGAKEMDTTVKNENFFQNPAALNAAISYHSYNRGKRISVMMPYSFALKDLADWYRQLCAESLGKAQDLSGAKVNIGPTPVKALGTTDQHSQVQLYREGPNDKLFTFLEVGQQQKDLQIGPAPDCAPELEYLAGVNLSRLFKSEKHATEYALLQSKRPCLTVLFDKVNARTVGQFIYLFEVATSFAGALFGINAYNQPAVELGKDATFALMQREGYEELESRIKPYAEIDSRFLV